MNRLASRTDPTMDTSSAIPFDYHSHNRRCGHAAGELADYIEAAASLGLAEFGVSDHNPCYWWEGDHPIPAT